MDNVMYVQSFLLLMILNLFSLLIKLSTNFSMQGSFTSYLYAQKKLKTSGRLTYVYTHPRLCAQFLLISQTDSLS